jgi:CRP-like cAMP-binding protein
METANRLALLREQPFVEGLTPAQIERLASLAREVRYDRGHVLFREGEECDDFYLIVSGLVALEIAPPEGSFRVDTLSAGDELGWSSFLMGRGRQFQARVLRDLHALAFSGADLRVLCEEDTAFGYELMRRLLGVVADRLQATRLQVMDMYWPVAKKAGA